jgi:hypothetical protein
VYLDWYFSYESRILIAQQKLSHPNVILDYTIKRMIEIVREVDEVLGDSQFQNGIKIH